jgi:hypothetical protein
MGVGPPKRDIELDPVGRIRKCARPIGGRTLPFGQLRNESSTECQFEIPRFRYHLNDRKALLRLPRRIMLVAKRTGILFGLPTYQFRMGGKPVVRDLNTALGANVAFETQHRNPCICTVANCRTGNAGE